MILNLTRIYILLLFLNLAMTSIGVSILMFTLTTYIATTSHQKEVDQRQANDIINKTFAKLDDLHTQSQKQIDAQGNLTSKQRNILIEQFAEVENKGGFATHQDAQYIENEILSVLSNNNNKTR